MPRMCVLVTWGLVSRRSGRRSREQERIMMGSWRRSIGRNCTINIISGDFVIIRSMSIKRPFDFRPSESVTTGKSGGFRSSELVPTGLPRDPCQISLDEVIDFARNSLGYNLTDPNGDLDPQSIQAVREAMSKAEQPHSMLDAIVAVLRAGRN